MSIRTKLFLTLVGVALLSLVLVGALGYISGKETVKRITFDHLTSVRASKANQITSFFHQLRIETEAIASSRVITSALPQFTSTFKALQNEPITDEQRIELAAFYTEAFLPKLNEHAVESSTLESVFPRSPATQVLQHGYIATNPYPIGEKNRLIAADDGSEYGDVHRRLHPELEGLEEQFGFYDLLLIDTAGNVVYSVTKETEFATNLIDGPYRNSNLAAAYRAALGADSSQERATRRLRNVHPVIKCSSSVCRRPGRRRWPAPRSTRLPAPDRRNRPRHDRWTGMAGGRSRRDGGNLPRGTGLPFALELAILPRRPRRIPGRPARGRNLGPRPSQFQEFRDLDSDPTRCHRRSRQRPSGGDRHHHDGGLPGGPGVWRRMRRSTSTGSSGSFFLRSTQPRLLHRPAVLRAL